MLDRSTLMVFVLAAFALLVSPGPAVLYIVARSIDQGRLAGIVSVLGVGLGSLVHVVAAALGLSALLVSSALAFQVVKYLGAAYLIYLGLHTLLSKEAPAQLHLSPQRGLRRIFSQGVLVNLLNPKTALFFFAFLPQFVVPGQAAAGQIVLLGLIFVLMGICTDGLYAVLAGMIGQWLRGSRGFRRAQRYFAGGIYLALGMTTAMAGTENR